jgi:hypothetical protein
LQIKGADDRSADIQSLERLAARRDLSQATARRIDEDLRKLRAGIEGERQAAYEIERTFGRAKNFVTLHDLRFEVGGYPVQIDHLILNRLAEIWVCESKHFADGATINDRGEWSRRWGGHEQGMESPVAQNRHHILLLQRAFDDGMIPKYRRLGALPMRPDLKSLVLISKLARMKWPRKRLPELDEVIKVEDIDKHIFDAIDAAPSRKILSLVTRGAVEQMGENLARLHDPKPIDWPAKFSFADRRMIGAESRPDSPPRPVPSDPHGRPLRPSKPSPIAVGRRCESCSGPITEAEVYFSSVKLRSTFGGKAICRGCQEADAATRSA